MQGHFHTGFDWFIMVGLAALLFRNLWVLLAAQMAASSNGALAHIGAAMGALA